MLHFFQFVFYCFTFLKICTISIYYILFKNIGIPANTGRPDNVVFWSYFGNVKIKPPNYLPTTSNMTYQGNQHITLQCNVIKIVFYTSGQRIKNEQSDIIYNVMTT